jgi:hypothetical protein
MGQAKIKRDKLKALAAAKKAPQVAAPASVPAKKIVIDISGVPLHKRADYYFKALFAMMESKLADPKEVNAICIHESMHLYYLAKAGVNDFIFTGPTITYSEKGGFDHTGASLQPKALDKAFSKQMPYFKWAFTTDNAARAARTRCIAN